MNLIFNEPESGLEYKKHFWGKPFWGKIGLVKIDLGRTAFWKIVSKNIF